MGDGGDLIGFFAAESLGEGDAHLAGSGADGMEVGGLAVSAAAQGLAVDGNLTAFHGETESGEVVCDAAGEGGGLDGLEDPREGVGAGNERGAPGCLGRQGEWLGDASPFFR